MDLALPLRSDLKRLSVAELEQRIDAASQAFEDARAGAAPWRLRRSSRGPIRHPVAYAIMAPMAYSAPMFWTAGPALVLSLLAWSGDTRLKFLMRMHLASCEMQDLFDEAKRRASVNASARTRS